MRGARDAAPAAPIVVSADTLSERRRSLDQGGYKSRPTGGLVERLSWHIDCTSTCIDGNDNMFTRQFLGLVMFATFAASSSAQSLYRCQDGTRVTYSDRACVSGATRQFVPTAGPPIAEQTAAVVRLRQDIAEFDVRWTARIAAAQSAGGAAKKNPGSNLAGVAARDTDSRCEPRGVESMPQIGRGAGSLVQANASRRY